MEINKKILIDFGGTISRDCLLFEHIARKSENGSAVFESPDSWDRIEVIGSINYFESIRYKYFELVDFYYGFSDFIKKYNANSSSCKTQTIVVFDNKPNIKIDYDQIQFLLAKKLAEESCSPNAVFVDSDKLALCKKLGISIAIDDDPRVALSLAFAGIKTILVSRLWNRGFGLNCLDFMVPSRKKEIIQKNLLIAEDWFDVSRKIVV